ncbi:MAG: SMC-Scp complex subunit ScpB [Myxococcota bacterium]
MTRSTARTGKLKRSKARKAPTETAPEREASVGELVAALEKGEDASAEAPAAAQPVDPEGLGLEGYKDDPSQDLPAPPAPEPGAESEARADGVELSDTLPMAPEDDISRVRGRASPRLVSVVESLLFAASRPLTVRDIRRVLKEPTVRQVQLALKQLQADTQQRGVVLGQVAGGFRLRTNPNNARWVQKMLAGKPARLSRSQLEALAVIAYRQPITKAEIDHVRGVDCGAVLRVLLERDLARIVGRKEEPGRPHLYGTTVEFLEFFNLRSLRDMPDLHEFRELTDESRATLRDELGDAPEEVEAEVLGQEVMSFDGQEGEGAESGETPEGDAAASGDESAAADGDAEASEASEDAAQAEPGGETSEGAEPPQNEAQSDSSDESQASQDEAQAESSGDSGTSQDEAQESDSAEADTSQADSSDEPEQESIADDEATADEDPPEEAAGASETESAEVDSDEAVPEAAEHGADASEAEAQPRAASEPSGQDETPEDVHVASDEVAQAAPETSDAEPEAPAEEAEEDTP